MGVRLGAGYGSRTRLHGLGSRCITDIRILHAGHYSRPGSQIQLFFVTYPISAAFRISLVTVGCSQNISISLKTAKNHKCELYSGGMPGYIRNLLLTQTLYFLFTLTKKTLQNQRFEVLLDKVSILLYNAFVKDTVKNPYSSACSLMFYHPCFVS